MASIFSMLDIIHAIVIAITAGYVTSFPPSLHSVVVRAYDYPITRILLFLSVLATAFYAPVTAVIYGIGIAIVSEDILRSSSRASFSKTKEEGFEQDMLNRDDKDLRDALNIQVAKKMNPVEEAMVAVKKAEKALQSVILRRNDR